MHLFQVAFYASGVYFALFVDSRVLIPFACVLALYCLTSAWLPGAKDLSIRKKIMNATWSDPSQGNITVRVPVRVQNILKIIQSFPKENRPSLTHFAIKAVGQILAAQSFLNGTLSLGKFIPYQTVDVSCLVDIGGGKDLAMVLIKGVDKMNVQEIGAFIKQKAAKMKKSDGGEQHKNQMKPFKIVPTCIVSFLMDTISFIANKLGFSFSNFKIEKHTFGAACVTSLGSLGFEDATAPFSGFTNCTMLLSANAVIRQPVVEGDNYVVGQVMNCNIKVDHRYVDGGNCAKLVSVFKNVFENPQQFMSKLSSNKKRD